MNKIIPITIIVVMSLVGVLGDSFIKLAGNGQRFIEWKWFLFGFVVYACTAIGWFFAMKQIKLGTLGVIYGVSTMLFLTVIGVFYFRESLTLVDICGLLLGISSILLLARFA